MQWVYRFDRASSKVQNAFRCYVMLRDGRKQRLHCCTLLTKVQSMWRGALGRRSSLALKWQFASPWEQLFDEEHLMYYFYNNHTRKSQWEAPYVPFRPFGYWPDPEPPPKAMHGKCTRCFLEKATRRCHTCIDKDTGYNLEYCFACYAIAHRENAELTTHQFEIMNDMENQFLLCVECHSQATRKCLDCDDAYCKAHFNAMHRRGNRAKHRSYGFALGAPVCIECENEIALKFCKQCGDQFCLKCYSHVHRKGKKKLHKYEDIVSLEDGLEIVHSFVEEEKEKKKLKANDEDEKKKPNFGPPVTKAFKLSKESKGKGKGKGKDGKSDTKKPKPPSNSRKEMALSAHKVDSAIPVRRNRPKNWKMLRPDKPRPPKLKQLVKEKKK